MWILYNVIAIFLMIYNIYWNRFIQQRHLEGWEMSKTSFLFMNPFSVLCLPLGQLLGILLLWFFLPFLKQRKKSRIGIKHWTKTSCGHVDTFFLLTRMCLRTAWLTCCLLAWRLYQRWIVIAAWFTCWINLHTQNNCCNSWPSSLTAK